MELQLSEDFLCSFLILAEEGNVVVIVRERGRLGMQLLASFLVGFK